MFVHIPPLLCFQAEMLRCWDRHIAIFRGTQPLGLQQTVTWSVGLEMGECKGRCLALNWWQIFVLYNMSECQIFVVVSCVKHHHINPLRGSFSLWLYRIRNWQFLHHWWCLCRVPGWRRLCGDDSINNKLNIYFQSFSYLGANRSHNNYCLYSVNNSLWFH